MADGASRKHILVATDRAEYLGGAVIMRAPLPGNCRDRRIVPAQKRVTSPLSRQRKRHGRLAERPPGGIGIGAAAQGVIAGVDRQGKTLVGQRVLMGAVDERLDREFHQPRQRCLHLHRTSLEQAAAATGKQGITAKQNARTGIGQVIQRMPRYRDDVKAHSDARQRDAFAIADWLGGLPYRQRPEYRATVSREQRIDPAHMVAMVMGDQDGRQLQMACLQRRLHGRRLAGVHDKGLVADDAKPDIVVLKDGNGQDGKHGYFLGQ